jgi:transposase
MLRTKPPQASFYGDYLYDRIIPEDHLLRRINQVVDFSFVHELVQDRYTPHFGRPAEDPEFMLRLCLLQYLYGDSDRQVIENARLNLAYKYFLGLAVDDDVPDDTTISHFRARRLGEEMFQKVFQNIVQQCLAKGLVKGSRQIIDSTHIVADMAITSLTGLIKLCRRNVLKTVENQDSTLAGKLGIKDIEVVKQDRFTRMEEGLEKEIETAKTLLNGVAKELKDRRLKVTPELRKDLELLEKAVADREDEAKDRLVSPVDPSARMGKKEHKHWAGYKGHMAIEEDLEIITAVETTPANVSDGSQLKPLLEQQEEALALKPAELSADKAYGIGANLDILESKGITGYVSLKEKQNTRGSEFTQDDFKHDLTSGTLTCPAGQVATRSRKDLILGERGRRKGIVFQFRRSQCTGCRLKERCHPTTDKVHGRSVHISVYEPSCREMRERMASEAGLEAYRKRYKIEHKIADLARYCGMRRCRYRGLARAKIHTLLAVIAANVKRMARLLWKPPDKALSLAVAG